jgi:FAD/FMN-containing dehydrogenase
MPLNPADPEFVSGLSSRLPGVVSEVPPSYLEEPRGRHHGIAGALARPRTVEEVSQIVMACAEARVGIVPYAGGTGLVGGQIYEGETLPLVVSVERMNAIRAVEPEDYVLIAEAGSILADIQRAADDVNRIFPLSLAAEGSCRIGGNLATNAGGVGVLRYGNARDLCLGVEAVLPDGSVMHGLKRLRKDNTGYDIRNLLVGSEGTLGIITAASLKLFPRPAQRETAFVVVPSPVEALALFHRMRDRFGEMISAYELISGMGLTFLDETGLEVSRPFGGNPDWIVLVEIAGGKGLPLGDMFEAVLADALEDGLAEDALIAQNLAQAGEFWRIRETIPEANRLTGAVSSHDISVPVSRIPEFIEKASAALARLDPSIRINAFGHLGDGNLHFNAFPARGRKKQDYLDIRAKVQETVHDVVDAFDGSISAEHGIGRLKTGDLVRYGDPVKLAAMRAVKAALDPLGIMNPGVVLG